VNFLKEMNKLPVCETLIISLVRDDHGLLPKMLHLLRRCSCIRKFKLLLSEDTPSKVTSKLFTFLRDFIDMYFESCDLCYQGT